MKGRVAYGALTGRKLTLDNLSLQFRATYIFALITLWVAATLANLVTVMGHPVDLVGLSGISLFISGLVYRTVRELLLSA